MLWFRLSLGLHTCGRLRVVDHLRRKPPSATQVCANCGKRSRAGCCDTSVAFMHALLGLHARDRLRAADHRWKRVRRPRVHHAATRREPPPAARFRARRQRREARRQRQRHGLHALPQREDTAGPHAIALPVGHAGRQIRQSQRSGAYTQ